MIVAINYSDENFKKSQKLNTRTAYKKGKVDKVIEYSPKDIDEVFYNKYKNILSKKRGGGYWLWKPYIILKTINNLNDSDYVFYCDSGAYYINSVNYLVKALNNSNQDIMVFDLPLIEEQWTKEDTFKILKCSEDRYRKTNQILATYMLIKVSENSKKFISQYLNYCTNSDCLIDQNLNKDNNPKLINHRHDQSILSLLSKKEGLISFRDPSQYGTRPWEYMSKGRIYNPLTYINSNYPQIVVSHRKSNINKFRIKELIKRQLCKLGILTESIYFKKKQYNIE